MKKITYFANCNSLYTQIFSTAEIADLQNKWNTILNKFPSVQTFPKDVKDILIADFQKLTDLYFEYDKIKKNNPLIEKEFILKTKGEKSQLLVFDYNKYYSKIINYFCEYCNQLGIFSCFYCDIHPIGRYSKKKNEPRLTVDLDHFYPKDQCPILALSLRNFVPSCQVCNSRIKGKTEFLKFYGLEKKSLSIQDKKDILNKLSPTSDLYDFNNNSKIFVFPQKGFSKKISYLNNINSYKICFKSNDVYQHEIDALYLEQRYNSITILSEALSILDLKRKFPPSKIKEIKEIFERNNYFVTEKQIEEIIFRKNYDINRHSNLLKLKLDLLE